MLLALVRKELLVLSRDIHGLAALFVLPVIFIIVMSMALKDVYSPHVDNLAWSVIDKDKSAISSTLIERWEKGNGTPMGLPLDWQRALREGQLKYVIQIEADTGNALAHPEKPDHPVIVLLTEPGLDMGVFSSLRAQIQATVTKLRVEILLSHLPADAQLDSDALNTHYWVNTERASAGSRPTSVQHNVPAWLVFGMFFVVTTIAGLFVEERQYGALNRLLSLGASPLMLLVAKILPFMLINCLQAMLMLGVGIYIIPLLGGDALSLAGINYLALLAMLLSISIAAISLALLIATILRSQAQVSAIGPMLNILMAAIGGIMVPTFVMPPAMQQLAHFSPMNWALEGLLDVLLRGGDLASISIEAAHLLLLAVIAIVLAYLMFRIRKS
ncbi:MAG: ABC transporter permease [Pseudomonadota bacterium]